MGASAECTYGCGSPDVFGEDNALGLNYEEVNQLVNIADDAIESLAGNSVVAARTKLARETRTNNGLAGNLSSDSDTKDNPRKLEGVSQKIQVSDGKNQGDGRGIGNRGGTCAVLSVYRLIAGCPLFRFFFRRRKLEEARAASGWVVHTRVVPRQELGEEGVVVGQRLTGGSWVVGSLASSSQVGELIRGLLVLLLDLVGDGACGGEGNSQSS